MNWENLQKNMCPYCDHPLKYEGDEYLCTSCVFIIEERRFLQIKVNRNKPKSNIKTRMKWQNLQISRCPMCSNMLAPSNGAYEILECTSPTCTFHIREDRMVDILKDPDHPANRFKITAFHTIDEELENI